MRGEDSGVTNAVESSSPVELPSSSSSIVRGCRGSGGGKEAAARGGGEGEDGGSLLYVRGFRSSEGLEDMALVSDAGGTEQQQQQRQLE